MSARYVTVLGTASQAPTRARSPGGYALQWDDQLVLFDPAEGFQRQCLLAGVVLGRATAVCLTHFHGDHCMGLPGVIQRRALSQNHRRLPVYFPAESADYFDHLLHSSIYDDDLVEPIPVSEAGTIGHLGRHELIAEPLVHTVPTIGYRIQEPDGVGLDAARLEQLELRGPLVGGLVRDGSVQVLGREIKREEVSVARPGQSMAFVMDTSLCEGAFRLCRGVDLVVAEATYLHRDRELAHRSGHMTAREVSWLARHAGARRLVLSHFSARYNDEAEFVAEASALFDDVTVARDLDRIALPPRIKGLAPADPAPLDEARADVEVAG